MVTEQIISWFLLFSGTSLIFRTSLWINLLNWIHSVQNKEILFFSLSLISLVLGIIIVVTHNVWELSPLVIVTLIGWISLMKACIFMFLPRQGVQFYYFIFKKETPFMVWFFRIFGSIYLILGVTVLSYIS